MKNNKLQGLSFIITILIVCFLVLLTSCGDDETASNQTAPTTSEEATGNHTDTTTETEPLDNPTISEIAMDNFFKKVNQSNYSIRNDDYVTISVYSKDLVYVDYADIFRDDSIYMTVNNKETFVVDIGEDGYSQDDIRFYGEGLAAEVVQDRTLYYWNCIALENIWDAFTNFSDEPLKFFIIDQDIKLQIAQEFAGINQMFISRVDEIYLTLDKEDPTSAQILITFTSHEQMPLKNITLTITFGVERPSSLPTDEWVNNPNRKYPEAPTSWNTSDEVAFSVVFTQGFDIERDLMPFPDFATYAFTRDQDSAYYYGQIWISDCHATEADMNAYIQKLLRSGFEQAEETLSDGTKRICYHHLLTDYGDGFYSYSSIYLEYDNGVYITTRKYFNTKSYEGLNNINNLITDKNFIALENDNCLTHFTASDSTYEVIEGLAGLFTYDLVLDVDISYNDQETADAYLRNYITKLEGAGYTLMGQSLYVLKTESYENKFEYNPDYALVGILQIRFKSQKYLNDEDANAAIEDAGFPSMELENYDSECRDIKLMYKILFNLDHEHVYLVHLSFDTPELMIQYLDDYLDKKLLASGYEKVDDPMDVKVPYKNLAYYNAEKGLIVALNAPDLDSTLVSFYMIKVGPDFEPLN